MYEKQYIKSDGAKVTERYQSWSETMFDQLWFGLTHTFVGLLTLVSLPVTAVYKWFKPVLLAYEERVDDSECLTRRPRR